jgi:hypothetical protein
MGCEELRIHADMARVLRAAGWVVHEPPDMRKAGPWTTESDIGVRCRYWEGGTSTATYAGQRPLYRPRPPAKSYEWSARLFGSRKYADREGGTASTMEEAMKRADEALLRLMSASWKRRLANREATPCGGDGLYLPCEEEA